MSALSDKLCLDGAHLAGSAILKILLLVKMILGLVGAFSVVFLFRSQGCGWIPNANGKVLYSAHVYLSFHTAFFFAVVYIIELIRMTIPHDNPCSYVLDARLSCLIRLLPVVGLVSQSFNMFTFALERLVSTLFPRDYERISAPYFGLVLVAFSIAAACSLDLSLIFFPISANGYVTTITVINVQNAATFQIAVGIPLSLEVLTITIFSLTYGLNHWKDNFETNPCKLNDRYQISENKKVIATLMPCFIVHFLLNSFTYGGLSLYPVFYKQFDPLTSTLWIEAFAHAQHYALVMPGILMWRTRKSQRISFYDAQAATAAHFERLNQLFRTPC